MYIHGVIITCIFILWTVNDIQGKDLLEKPLSSRKVPSYPDKIPDVFPMNLSLDKDLFWFSIPWDTIDSPRYKYVAKYDLWPGTYLYHYLSILNKFLCTAPSDLQTPLPLPEIFPIGQ